MISAKLFQINFYLCLDLFLPPKIYCIIIRGRISADNYPLLVSLRLLQSISIVNREGILRSITHKYYHNITGQNYPFCT